MRAILSVATTTFRESIRNRTVLAILLLALAFIASAQVLAALSLDQRVRVIMDWGLFCVSAFGVVLAILIGVNLVHKEVRRKTLYVILSRPIHRWQYVVGKYLGLAFTLLVEVGALSVALVILLAIEGVAPDHLLMKALYVSLVEVLLVAAVAVMFASFSTPYLSGFLTLGLFVVGRSLPVLNKLADKVDSIFAHGLLKGLFFTLPDLADFNLATRVVHGLDIPAREVAFLSVYGMGYVLILLFVAIFSFSRRDLA
jgi:ABC-type transport system involved in multi-copper enzyme maturation permease subunit